MQFDQHIPVSPFIETLLDDADAAAARTTLGAAAAATLPTLTNGQSVLGSSFSLSTTGIYQDTGLSVSLPAAGTYLITTNARVSLRMTSGTGYAVTKLYNATAAADVANSERMAKLISGADDHQDPASATYVVTVGAASTIKLYAMRDGGGTFANSAIDSDNNGRTTLAYVKLAD